MTGPERYAARVAARRCVQCAAGLQLSDGVRCHECAEADRTDPGKAARDARHRATPGRRGYMAARMAVSYREAAEARLCVDGCGTPATRFKRCASCRRKRAAWNKAYRERLHRAEAA